jgi:hypothetical protein
MLHFKAFKLVVFAAVCLTEGVAASVALAGSTPTILGGLPGSTGSSGQLSQALAINDAGQVVGWSFITNSPRRW